MALTGKRESEDGVILHEAVVGPKKKARAGTEHEIVERDFG